MTVERRSGVEVLGLARLRRDLRDLGDDLGDLKQANQRAAAIVAERAAARAPRRTGRLAASLRGTRGPSRASILAGSAARVPYAGPIHWGWEARNIEPQPFIAEAVEHTRPAWWPVYERALQAACDKVQGA